MNDILKKININELRNYTSNSSNAFEVFNVAQGPMFQETNILGNYNKEEAKKLLLKFLENRTNSEELIAIGLRNENYLFQIYTSDKEVDRNQVYFANDKVYLDENPNRSEVQEIVNNL